MCIVILPVFYPEISYDRFLLNYVAFLWLTCVLGGNLVWGLLGSPFYSGLPGSANTWVFPVSLLVVAHFL